MELPAFGFAVHPGGSDPEFEYQRTWKVARQFMDRTCKDRPYLDLPVLH